MAYFLKSTRLGFRCWRPEDLPLAMELWGDPKVNAFISGHLTPEMVRARLAAEIEQMKEFGVQYWPVFLLQGNQHVGCAGLRPYRIEQSVYELGFHLRPMFWRRGLAKEAGCTVIDYAFRTLNASALFAGHHPSNETSRQVLLKLGFVFTHEERYPPTGLMNPSYLLRRT
jgi:[ribosomal protein S5]-alanine N-acetyltransferase